MTKAKSFDVIDCEQSNVNHRHSCFQQIVIFRTMLVEPFDIVIRVGHLKEYGSCAVWCYNAVKLMTIAHNLLKTEHWNHTKWWSTPQMNYWFGYSTCATKLRVIWILWWGWPKTIAGSNAMVLVGKWMVWAKKLDPNVHQDSIRKLFPMAFYWYKNMVVPSWNHTIFF